MSDGDSPTTSDLKTPKRSTLREEGELDESPLKRLDRSKSLDAKKIKDSLKKSKKPTPAQCDFESTDSNESESDREAEGSFLDSLNATSLEYRLRRDILVCFSINSKN